MFSKLTAISLLACVAAPLFADGPVTAPAMTGQLGDELYLIDQNKMTLYTFDRDEEGVSNCYGQCAINWPPLLADENATLSSGYSLVERNDGTLQVAYQGDPLYLWIRDEKPGDMTGDGVNDVWHTARPE